MQDGEYILDRWMVTMLRDICESRGISFRSYSDDWLLEFEHNSVVSRVLGYRFDLNSSVAGSIAQDKVATYQLLSNAGIDAVPHALVRTKISEVDREVMSRWDQVVIKHLTGAGGHGVRLYDNIGNAISHIEQSGVAGWAVSPFIGINREIRIILLDGELLLSYEKEPILLHGLKMFNLGLGAVPRNIEAGGGIVQLARKAQLALGLRLSTIDIVEKNSGEYTVLEVNDSISMEHYARYSEENRRIAEGVYAKIIDTIFNVSSVVHRP
jgi:glutathione synthase/RimK-type ligase-like ATP-grasp enzyme